MPESVAHDRVVGIAEHEVSVGAVAALIRSIFPDFTYEHSLPVCLVLDGRSHLSYEAVGQLIGHIKPYAVSTP